MCTLLPHIFLLLPVILGLWDFRSQRNSGGLRCLNLPAQKCWIQTRGLGWGWGWGSYFKRRVRITCAAEKSQGPAWGGCFFYFIIIFLILPYLLICCVALGTALNLSEPQGPIGSGSLGTLSQIKEFRTHSGEISSTRGMMAPRPRRRRRTGSQGSQEPRARQLLCLLFWPSSLPGRFPPPRCNAGPTFLFGMELAGAEWGWSGVGEGRAQGHLEGLLALVLG